MDLLPRLIAFLEAHPDVEAAFPWVVGVSGGPDSLALLHLLRRLLRERFPPPPAGPPLIVAHLDHSLRPESGAESEFVARMAAQWGLPLALERSDVAGLARTHGMSVEEAGRVARYGMLVHVAETHAAGAVLTGHNADDQAETVLMHLLRGAGTAGLRGMLPITPMHALRLPNIDARPGLWLVRPLLTTTRAEIEAYCEAHDLQPLTDSSNADPTYFRNRLRNEVLPYLETINPHIRAALRRTADVIAADHEVLAHTRDAVWAELLLEHAPGVRIALDRAAFRELPVGLQRGLLRKAVAILRPALRDVDFAPITRAAALAAGRHSGRQATLPGKLLMRVEPARITIATQGSPPPPVVDAPAMAVGAVIALPASGSLSVGEAGWLVEVSRPDTFALPAITSNADPWQVSLDADSLPTDLALRTRRKGDRLRPLGMDGHSVKLSDFMINEHIPATSRDRLALVAAGDQVVWVPGRRLDERFKVTAQTTRIVRVRFIPPE
ncbi:MAG: tRNA lysidine(34) synthetase TilS [Anaerolineales bacterium]